MARRAASRTSGWARTQPANGVRSPTHRPGRRPPPGQRPLHQPGRRRVLALQAGQRDVQPQGVGRRRRVRGWPARAARAGRPGRGWTPGRPRPRGSAGGAAAGQRRRPPGPRRAPPARPASSASSAPANPSSTSVTLRHSRIRTSACTQAADDLSAVEHAGRRDVGRAPCRSCRSTTWYSRPAAVRPVQPAAAARPADRRVSAVPVAGPHRWSRPRPRRTRCPAAGPPRGDQVRRDTGSRLGQDGHDAPRGARAGRPARPRAVSCCRPTASSSSVAASSPRTTHPTTGSSLPCRQRSPTHQSRCRGAGVHRRRASGGAVVRGQDRLDGLRLVERARNRGSAGRTRRAPRHA